MPTIAMKVKWLSDEYIERVGLKHELSWVFHTIAYSVGWDEAREQCFKALRARSGEILLQWDGSARELLAAQVLVSALVWASPIGGRREHLQQREDQATAMLGASLYELPVTLVDPERLRRRDPEFLHRCTGALTALGVGGA